MLHSCRAHSAAQWPWRSERWEPSLSRACALPPWSRLVHRLDSCLCHGSCCESHKRTTWWEKSKWLVHSLNDLSDRHLLNTYLSAQELPCYPYRRDSCLQGPRSSGGRWCVTTRRTRFRRNQEAQTGEKVPDRQRRVTFSSFSRERVFALGHRISPRTETENFNARHLSAECRFLRGTGIN